MESLKVALVFLSLSPSTTGVICRDKECIHGSCGMTLEDGIGIVTACLCDEGFQGIECDEEIKPTTIPTTTTTTITDIPTSTQSTTDTMTTTTTTFHPKTPPAPIPTMSFGAIVAIASGVAGFIIGMTVGFIMYCLVRIWHYKSESKTTMTNDKGIQTTAEIATPVIDGTIYEENMANAYVDKKCERQSQMYEEIPADVTELTTKTYHGLNMEKDLPPQYAKLGNQ